MRDSFSEDTVIFPLDTSGVMSNIRAAELCRRWDFVKIAPLFHRNRLVRGVQRKYLLPYLVGKLSSQYSLMWCNGIAPIPLFKGDIIVDLDDPKRTAAEAATLNSPNVLAVVVTTEKMKDALEVNGCRKEIIVIPSGVNKTENSTYMVENPPDKDTLIVGYVSSRIKIEEIDTMIDILDHVSQAGLPVQLWLVGNADDPRLSRNDIRFFGYVPHQDILGLIRYFDLSLYIRHEDFGGRFSIKLIESFSCGVPVVSVDTAEAFLVTQSDAGLVCPRKSLYRTVLTLLKDIPRRQEMAGRGKQFAKNYSWDKIAKEYRERVLEPFFTRT